MKAITKSGLKIKSNVKAAGFGINHNRSIAGLKVKSNVKAAGFGINHNRPLSR